MVCCKKRKQCCCLRLKTTLILVSFLGVCLITLGIVLAPIVDKIFQDEIDKNLILHPDSPTFDAWRQATIPIHANYYFFDVLNVEEVKQGKKPYVEQRGPYSYIAHTKKINITWDNENGTVTYDEKSWYVFNPNLSCSTCDPFIDKVTTVNIPLVAMAEMLKTFPDYLHWKHWLTLLLKYSEPLFITHKVHDLLWGYKDPLLDELQRFRDEHPLLKPFIPKIDSTVLLQPNNTFQGLTTIYTGAKDIHLVEAWKRWKGKETFGLWLTKFANMINGTDGRQFAPQVTKTDTIYFVVCQLCRSLYVTYDHQRQIQDIDVYRFVIPPKLFLNGTENPDNAAFYPQGFLPTGILDPRRCQGGKGNSTATVFISAPHFYLGDPSLVDSVIGLKPNKEKHELLFDIEPHLGVPISNYIRLQVNVFIEPIQDVIETSGIPNVYMPMMWFEEHGELDSDTTALFRKLLMTMEIIHYVEIALICIGGLLLLTVIVIVYRVKKRKKRLSCCCYITEEQQPLVHNVN